MNKSKFTWAIVVPILLAVLFGIVSFLGANFLNISKDTVWGMPHMLGCVVIAIVIALLLGGTVTAAILFKRTNGSFKLCLIGEMTSLLLFVFFAVFFITKTSPFPHFFTVMSHKADIKNGLEAGIAQAENMFAAYESYAENREKLYKFKLQSVVAAKMTNPAEYNEYGFDATSGVSDAKQIENKMFTVHADLFPTNYSNPTGKNGLKEVSTEWLQKARNVTNSPVWIIGIAGVVNDIDKKSDEWCKMLVVLSQKREQGEQATDFAYSLNFGKVKENFTKLERPGALAIILAVVAYALMLLAYVSTKRSPRFPGFKRLVDTRKELNEL